MIKQAILVIVCLLLPTSGDAAPQWIEHASAPGPDIPPVGLSRFDQIFMQQDNDYQIPYPFEKLVEHLEAGIDNRGKNGLRQVLVPIGRSLQRNTAAPDYFKFPRSLIALEGEPRVSTEQAGLVLEYRLFIAHQPSTETLEVISYNNEVGRFEFQVVENYARDQIPVVRQANRVMCLSCHQNAAPIFPETPWTETSFNVEVAKELIRALPQKFTSLISVLTPDAGVIDVLVERANYLSVAQYIWKNGCSTSRCRAALLRAALQFRLSGKSSFEWQHSTYRVNYHEDLKQNWKQNWSQGLALAGSRIVTLDSFDQDQRTIEQDPLSARPAHTIWYEADAVLARGIVYRLAGFLTQADIQRFDRRLIALEASQTDNNQSFRSPCRIAFSRDSTLELSCSEIGTIDGLQATFEIELEQTRINSIRVLQLKFPGDPHIWQPEVRKFNNNGGTIDIELSDANSDLSQRVSNGNRIRLVRLTLDSSLSSPFSDARMEIEMSDDFRYLDEALAQLLVDNATGKSDSLSALAFRRRVIVDELMRQLGMKTLNWPRFTKPPVKTEKATAVELNGDLVLLYPYCAHCHNANSVNPPGFLYGEQLHERLVQCAPRILTRLKAWQDGYNFPRSPMPPPASPGMSGTSAESWPRSDHYRLLLNAIQGLVDNNYLDYETVNWPDTIYPDLPPCLAIN